MRLQKRSLSRFDGLVSYADQINERNQGSGSAIVVIQNDVIVTEHYAGFHSHLPNALPIQADSQFNVASCRKSYIGFAVAVAVYEGKISSIDDQVLVYLPELDPAAMAGTTIRHLLTHTHGLARDGEGHVIREFAPGRSWAYHNVNIELLTAVVRRVTGKSVAQIVRERVFEPLGFLETGWRTERNERLVQVIHSPAGAPDWAIGNNADGDGDQKNLFVSARDFAYWGYLHLTKGRIHGRQVVSAEIFAMSTSLQSPLLSDPTLPNNGFLWFVQDRPSALNLLGEQVPVGSYQIVGVTGPLLLVIPEQNLVVARMSNRHPNYGGDVGYLHYLREFGNRVMQCLDPTVSEN
jgi:CubicO group peptidase (beta-lactamase class C family)